MWVTGVQTCALPIYETTKLLRGRRKTSVYLEAEDMNKMPTQIEPPIFVSIR
jgi:hypothetical protein